MHASANAGSLPAPGNHSPLTNDPALARLGESDDRLHFFALAELLPHNRLLVDLRLRLRMSAPRLWRTRWCLGMAGCSGLITGKKTTLARTADMP